MSIAMVGLLLASASAVDCAEVRVMTYNIRLALESDGPNRWEARRSFFVGQVAILQPAVLGLQEVVDSQLQDLRRGLPNYQFLGVARDDGRKAGEYSNVAYDRRRYRALDSGTFWLSETPDRPSKGWDAAYRRVATWGRLVDRHSGRRLLVVNTHLDNEGETARRNGASLIRDWISHHRRGGESVIVTGDFNAVPGSAPVTALTATTSTLELADARVVSLTPPIGPEGTFNGFARSPQKSDRIDYVLVGRDWQVRRYAVPDWSQDGRVASDHFPVVVDVADRRCPTR